MSIPYFIDKLQYNPYSKFMAQNEATFYKYLKQKLKSISIIKVSNTCIQGQPDILAQNSKGVWFLIELKVIMLNKKPKLSAHQQAFFHRFPKNSFILIKQKSPVASAYKLYTGDQIQSLVTCGVKTTPIACDLDACALIFENL